MSDALFSHKVNPGATAAATTAVYINMSGQLCTVGPSGTETPLVPVAAIGTTVQAYDAALTALAAGSDFVQFTGPLTTTKVFTLPDASSTLLVSGGALGTPSSGVATNLTGTASININGTVGGTTPASVAATTISATGVVTTTYGTASGAIFGANQHVRINSASNVGYAIGIPATGGIVGGYYVAAGANTYDGGMEYAGTTRALSLHAAGLTIATLSSTGLAVTGSLSATTTIRTGGYTVATLPAGASGDRAYVTDASAPAYNTALTGGGAVVVPVFRNATVWVSA